MTREPKENIKEVFLKNIKDHQMLVQLDDGTFRNLLFKKHGSSNYWFGIQTWPGNLCIYGDMGTYVFSRVEDMFRFSALKIIN